VLGNFDVTSSQATITFPNSGTWYEYLTGATFNATGAGQSILLQPGEYKVYINRNLTGGGGTGGGDPVNSFEAKILPNLIGRSISGIATANLYLQLPTAGSVKAALYNTGGQRIRLLHNAALSSGTHTISLDSKLSGLAPGLYMVSVETVSGSKTMKLVIQ
jgi:hypothetical protein